jgi:hypothetical protein
VAQMSTNRNQIVIDVVVTIGILLHIHVVGTRGPVCVLFPSSDALGTSPSNAECQSFLPAIASALARIFMSYIRGGKRAEQRHDPLDGPRGHCNALLAQRRTRRGQRYTDTV